MADPALFHGFTGNVKLDSSSYPPTIRGIPSRIGVPVNIPEPVRSAALTRMEDYGITAVSLGVEFLKREGYGAFDDYIERVGELYGTAEAERVRARIRELAARDAKTLAGGGALGAAHRQAVVRENLPRYALIAGPDAEFIKGLDYAIELVGQHYAEPGTALGYEKAQEVSAQLDALFAKRGIPYRLHGTTIIWAGDRGQHQLVIEPALHVLADGRLGGARNELEAALGHLRVGTQKELEDAIEEAGKSVESALKVLATETATAVAANATVKPLFDGLKAAGLLPDYTDNLVQAAARIRNKTGGHGAGGQPRQIDQDIAVAAVNAAATAIVLIGGRLP